MPRENLKLMVDPVYTARKLSRCATTWALATMTKEWLDAAPKRYAYWLVPKEGESIKNDLTFLNDPRITKVPIHYRADRYRELWLPSDEHRNVVKEWAGLYGDYDVLLTTRNRAIYYRRLTSIASNIRRMMVLSERYPLLTFKKTVPVPSVAMGHRVWSIDALSNYTCWDHIYVTAPFEKTGILAEARRYLSPSEVKELSKKIVLAGGGNELLNKVLPSGFVNGKKVRDHFVNDPFTVFYTQRIGNVQRRFDLIHKALSVIYSKLNSDGMDIQIKVCTNSTTKSQPSVKHDMKFLDVEKLPRREFWKQLGRGQVFLSMSVEEGLPNGLVEATQLGVIGIVNRMKWSEDMFGRDYPWLVDNLAQAIAYVKQIYHDREGAWTKWVHWYNEYFAKTVLDRPRESTLLINQTEDWFKELDVLIKAKAPSKTATAIQKGADKAGLHEINIQHLKGIPGTHLVSEMRKVNLDDHLYFRLPFRWRLGYNLRTHYGWSVSDKPWVLVR